ncbi:MAG: monovalent cation/H+ antiporter subunit D family protein [Myxococcota bacterium]|nr:monovalent cation/H+ antiporter subunit D family protein [Myxococcota bacterium]
METVHSATPLYAVLVSLVTAGLIILFGKHKNIRESWTLLAGVVKFALILSMLPVVLGGQTPEISILTLTDGISLKLRVDPFGLFFALIASGLWIVTSLYSIGYMRTLKEHAQTRYYASFAVCLSATIGVALAANILTFFIFYEILTVATYPLVIHKESPEAIRAGRKYLFYTLTAGVFLLAALVIAYAIAGTLEFTPGGFLAGHADKTTLKILFVMFIAGVGVKAGIMPLHSWLPAAMIAPTPVSALLHAVAVVKSGVFGCLRILWFVFGTALLKELDVWWMLATAAAITILIGSLIALAQDNLKRRLAYSTISQLSYIVLGAAMLAPSALLGSTMHIVNHAFMKITLFFCAGAIYAHTHRTNISQLNGIGRKMPITMGAFTIGALGMAGIPPVAGFLSKWYLSIGALEAEAVVFLVVFLLSSVLNAAYFFPIIVRAFFKKPDSNDDNTFSEASAFMVVPLGFAGLYSLVLFFAPDAPLRFFEIAQMVVRQVTGGGVGTP